MQQNWSPASSQQQQHQVEHFVVLGGSSPGVKNRRCVLVSRTRSSSFQVRHFIDSSPFVSFKADLSFPIVVKVASADIASYVFDLTNQKLRDLEGYLGALGPLGIARAAYCDEELAGVRWGVQRYWGVAVGHKVGVFDDE